MLLVQLKTVDAVVEGLLWYTGNTLFFIILCTSIAIRADILDSTHRWRFITT
jgi:hypothetical protein